MLGLIISLWGNSITQTITYYNYRYPQVKKEIVMEAEPIAIPEVVVEPPKEKEKEYDAVACSCIVYASQFLDIPPNTDAIDLEPNSQPYEGGGVLLNYKGVGHVAIIVSLDGEYMTIKESNYKHCQYTTRKLFYDDPSLVGFYK